jgi:hypothetical protein
MKTGEREFTSRERGVGGGPEGPPGAIASGN